MSNDRTIFDRRKLWCLPANTHIVEIDSGREFIVGSRPGTLWHGNTFCDVSVLDLPVLVVHGPTLPRNPRGI